MIGKRAGGRAELIARYHRHICSAAAKVAQSGSLSRPVRNAGYSRLERNILERDRAEQRVLVKFIASVIDSMGHEPDQELAPVADSQFVHPHRVEAQDVA